MESEEAESYKILPRATANVLRRIQRKQRIIDWAIFAAVVVNALVLAAVSTKFLDTTVSLVTNLVSTVLVGVVMWIARKKE